MIELISIIGALAMCILTPIEVSRIRSGWVRRKFAGDRQKFLMAYRKQLGLFTFPGIVFGVPGIITSFLDSEPGEQAIKLVSAAIWFAVAGIGFVSVRLLRDVQLPEPLTSSSST